jgi:hypothetical protein
VVLKVIARMLPDSVVSPGMGFGGNPVGMKRVWTWATPPGVTSDKVTWVRVKGTVLGLKTVPAKMIVPPGATVCVGFVMVRTTGVACDLAEAPKQITASAIAARKCLSKRVIDFSLRRW